MLAKSWKKIGLIILIIACLYNVTVKLVNRVSFSEEITKFVSQIKIIPQKATNQNETNSI